MANWDATYSSSFTISTNASENSDMAVANAGSRSARTVLSIPSSKLYFEQFPNNLVQNGTSWGVLDAAHSQGVGSDADDVQFFNALSSGSGHRNGIAIDGTAGKGWWRDNGGSWQGGASPDPVTGTGGIVFSSLAGLLYWGFMALSTNENTRLVLLGAHMTDAIPSGYTAWGDLTPPGVQLPRRPWRGMPPALRIR